MFENEMQTRAAICGTGLLIAIIFLLTHLPLLLMVVPVAILFLGLVAEPDETHAVWYGILNVLGLFALPDLTDDEKANYATKKHYFWFGEVAMAAVLAGIFALPAGAFFQSRTDPALAFIVAGILFLPLFVFLPKLIRRAMQTDADTVIDLFGKNEQTKKIFWSLFVAIAVLSLGEIMDPVAAQTIIAIISGSTA